MRERKEVVLLLCSVRLILWGWGGGGVGGPVCLGSERFDNKSIGGEHLPVEKHSLSKLLSAIFSILKFLQAGLKGKFAP